MCVAKFNFLSEEEGAVETSGRDKDGDGKGVV